MYVSEEIRRSLFNISGEVDFEKISLEIFRYQVSSNLVYKEMVRLLGIGPGKINFVSEIPFIPVSLFRDQQVLSGDDQKVQKIFTSSGTTGSVPSRHLVTDLALYKESFTCSFWRFYGDPAGYRFLALLPGYMERQGSSLIYMMDFLIRNTIRNGSGFYLSDLRALQEQLEKIPPRNIKTILFGASYALLDFAEQYPMDLSDVIIMETGGMKGRRKEMIREELHEILTDRFKVNEIHSEYGMTELLSQAYSKGSGIFRTPPWMKILVRDTNDPMHILPHGQTGGINIIDLANLNSCSFIATQDLGKVHKDGSFEVLGRFDDSDIRGCNLLVV
jgi:phenylacetate-coenzyme A ligase PaaK-like adenylate-forming protein